MKRMLIIIMSAILMMPSISAQEHWKPQTPSNSIKFRVGTISLERNGYTYNIYMKTDNVLDENLMSIHLGDNREEAMESINKLIEISNEIGQIRFFDKAEIYVAQSHIVITDIKGKIHLGEATISRSELKKMKGFIEKGK